MRVKSWRVFGDRTIACMLHDQEVRQWLQNDLVVGPGEAGIIIKDGAAQEVITEERQRLGGWAERYIPNFKQWFGRKSDYRVLMVSTVPFEMGFNVNLVTLDQEEIPGELLMQCSVNTDEMPRLLALLGSRPSVAGAQATEPLMEAPGQSRVLAIPDLARRLRIDLMARVLQPSMREMRHDELRGNRAHLQSIEAAAQRELASMLGDWGLKLNRCTILWGLSSEDKAQLMKKTRQLEDEAIEFEDSRRMREVERNAEMAKLAYEAKQEESRRAQAGRIELAETDEGARRTQEELEQRHRIMLAELRAEEQQCAYDLQLAQMDVERERGKLEIEKARAALELVKDEKDFGRQQRELEFKMVQEDKRERMRMEQEHQIMLLRVKQEEMRMQYDMMLQQSAIHSGMEERVVTSAVNAGLMTDDALKALMNENTRRHALDRGEGVADKFYGAEAAGNNVEALQKTEDRERAHQYQTTELASQMMQAAKQTPASGIPTRIVTQTVTPTPGFTGTCRSCGNATRANWVVCPTCGEAVQ